MAGDSVDLSQTMFIQVGQTLTDSEAEQVPTPLSGRDQEAVEALPAGSALLIVQRGSSSGARFLLNAEVTNAGRSPKSDIFLDDVTVSRKHCQFIAREQGHVVRDSGALNGTYVNRERVDEAQLRAGDEVQIGKFRLTYHPSPKNALEGAGGDASTGSDG